jgi:hypothetical protein
MLKCGMESWTHKEKTHDTARCNCEGSSQSGANGIFFLNLYQVWYYGGCGLEQLGTKPL